jgi:hypothetical protein
MSTEYLAALTGLAAVILSPLVAIWVTRSQSKTAQETLKRQIQADIVIKSRKEWISDLRLTVAEFLSITVMLAYGIMTSGVPAPDKATQLERAAFLRSKIFLLLNPTEDEHIELARLTDQALGAAVGGGSMSGMSLGDLNRALTASAQSVLKNEWEVVKRLESPPNKRLKLTARVD